MKHLRRKNRSRGIHDSARSDIVFGRCVARAHARQVRRLQRGYVVCVS